MKGKSHLRFASLSRVYDPGLRILFAPFGGERHVRDRMLDSLDLQPGETVIDIGCGTGTMSLLSARRVGRNGSVVGVDPSREMLARARQKAATAPFRNILLHDGGSDPLPYPDSRFSAVIFFLAIHEMAHDDRLEAIREALRLLMPGGRVLFGELHRPNSWFGKLLHRVILAIEEEEARDFFNRGLEAIIREAVGNRLYPVRSEVFANGLLESRIYRKVL